MLLTVCRVTLYIPLSVEVLDHFLCASALSDLLWSLATSGSLTLLLYAPALSGDTSFKEALWCSFSRPSACLTGELALGGDGVLRGGDFSRSSRVKRDSETARRSFRKFSRTSLDCLADEDVRPRELVLAGEEPSFSLERATFSRCHVEYRARVSRTRSAEVDRGEGMGGRSL